MTKVYHRYAPHNFCPRHVPGETATVQAAQHECDINAIVTRMLAGNAPGVLLKEGTYSDNTTHTDMKTNLDVIRRHQSSYNELPEDIRMRYKTPLEYYNAQQQALEQEASDQHPLDVSGPTDSKPVSSKRKELNETQTPEPKNGKKDLQTSNRHEVD